ncbi:MAG TPA: DegV family protein, partial [Fontimonas sp.]
MRSSMRIGVVTDSTCDLPAQFYSDHQIGLLPVQIRLGEEVWTDDRDPQATLRFYKELSDKGADADSFPQTAEQIRDRFLASTV